MAYNIQGTYTVSSVTTVNVGNMWFCVVYLTNPASVNNIWNSIANLGNLYTPQGWLPQNITVSSSSSGTSGLNLNGSYSILTVSRDTITLNAPNQVNWNWNNIGAGTAGLSATLSGSGQRWVGPFLIESTGNSILSEIWLNVVAQSGIYRDDGTNQYAGQVILDVRYQQADINGNPIGNVYTTQIGLDGSSVLRTQIGVTSKIAVPVVQQHVKYLVSVARNTPKNTATGTVVDEVKWKDMYGVMQLQYGNLGNVTTVRARTVATTGALSVKSRKLNMLVQRCIYIWNGSAWQGPFPTNHAGHIFINMALDPYIGNRQQSELDMNGIINTCNIINGYFGNTVATEFNYTFDKSDLSFEESVAMIANAIFCTAYRQGSVIKFAFETPNKPPSILFNHRNKIPGSETRTINFGINNDNDGIEYTYVSPIDDSVITYYLPSDQSAINPKKIESVGVRSRVQAHFHAWREYQKLQYQNINVEFDATQESELVTQGDYITVADNTRDDTQDGEIIAQNGLVLTTSQPVNYTGWPVQYVSIQQRDGTVWTSKVNQPNGTNQLVLQSAPPNALSVGIDLFARATYTYIETDTGGVAGKANSQQFIVTEKTSKDNWTNTIRASNYDARFYAHDKDFINGVITELT